MAYGEAAREGAREDARPEGPSAETLAFLEGWGQGPQCLGVDVTYDVGARTVTSWWNHAQRPNMTPEVMRSIRAFYCGLRNASLAGDDWFRFYLMRARGPKVWSYGGDFALLLDVIERRDAASLAKYGETCIRAIHEVLEGVGERTISIAAVDGTCLGGGLEGAVSADFVVAEKSVKMGVPEANIGMFPGAGGYSMLARKIGRREAERLITSGAYFTGEEAHDLGIVDVLCEDGEIEAGIKELTETIAPRFNTYLTTVRARRASAHISLGEMKGMIRDWVDAAMNMEPHHLMLMRHLMTMQAQNAAKAKERAADNVVSTTGEPVAQKPNPFREKEAQGAA
jgi:DSF synthase